MKYSVYIKTGVKHRESVQQNEDGSLIVTTHSKPNNGEANKSLISLLSDYFSIPKTRISIISGHKSYKKIVEIIE